MSIDRPPKLPWPLDVGDLLLDWTLPATTQAELALSALEGGPLVILFIPVHDQANWVGWLAGFGSAHPRFQSLGVNIVGIVPAPLEQVREVAARAALPFPLLADSDGAVTLAYRAVTEMPGRNDQTLVPARTVFVADARHRVLQVYGRADMPPEAAGVVAFCEALAALDPPRQQARHAPVLMVPNVLAPEVCQQLIQIWETEGNEDSGFMRAVDNRTVGLLDYSHKKRRDHFLLTGPMRQRLMHYLYHRVKPLIKQAFNFDATRFEDFRIACYDSSRGGYFRPHRDNTTPATAHRVFAMSLNLNQGDYEGGFLRFPEYGPHLYQPGLGEAVIFSCSLMHEATDVTAGRRFVLLTFLYGDKEGLMREKYVRENEKAA